MWCLYYVTWFIASKSTSTPNRTSSNSKEPSSNSKRDQVDVKCFLPIRYIGQLRRQITVMEEEIISDEQMVLECKEAKEMINNVKKQMDNYNYL